MVSATPSMDASRFHSERPTDLRDVTPWHRFAYTMSELPLVLERASKRLELSPTGRVLDYGCADMPYRRFFSESADFVPADLPGNPNAQVEIRPDGTLPVEDNGFDAVMSTQVLEHVGDPATYLNECERVLR